MIEVSSNRKDDSSTRIERIQKFQAVAIIIGAIGIVAASFPLTLFIVVPVTIFLVVTGFRILNIREGKK